MKKSIFYKKLIDFLEIESVIENDLSDSFKIKDLEEYDSFFILTIVAFVDTTFSISLTAKQLFDIETIGDLMGLIGNENFVD